MRQKFYFVAGEQVTTAISYTLLDAWLKIENRHRAGKAPIASEFLELKIEAFDNDGISLGKKTWEEWNEALLQDTYGSDWRQHLEHAAKLVR